MDLHISTAAPTAAERDTIDAAFGLLAPTAADATAGDRPTR